MDLMKALISGASETPYAHGCFIYDIVFEDNYPNGPPKVNLSTTGHG
jgi:ubiquitin-protein ligase